MQEGRTVFVTGNGFCSEIRVQQMRQPIQRRQACQASELLYPVPDSELCTTDLPREPSGYRDMSQGCWFEALPHRHSPSWRGENTERMLTG